MEKLEYKRRDLAAENFARLSELFPEAVTETMDAEGRLVRAIDADVLRQAIAAEVVEGPKERYQFTWPDKKKSVVLANAPSTKAFRLEREKSVGRDGKPGSIDTENLYIEGDNLDALKLLQETYLGKVKMIYIDPPYNTGSDAFVYDDDYSTTKEEFAEASGARDEEGNRVLDMRVNNESNGRFHTDWLNMMYPRLRLAKDLLADDGVLFVSIDYNENYNMRNLCDMVFSSAGFIGEIYWESKTKSQNTITSYNKLQPKAEMILVYSRQSKRRFNLVKVGEKEYNFKDEKGIYREHVLEVMNANGVRGRETMVFDISAGVSTVSLPEGKQWKLGQAQVATYKERGDLFIRDGKVIIKMRPDDERTERTEPFWGFFPKDMGTAESAKKELTGILGAHGFETVKPVEVIERLVYHATEKDDIICDFFSGSATTAHAVMQLNAEDGGKRRFILVQIPEMTPEKSEARKAGYNTICDIGEERIRRAGAKILSEQKSAGGTLPDVGFRVLRIDSANKQDVTRRPQEFRQEELLGLADNIKADRMPDDLLLETMLELGIPLSESIETVSIGGKPVYSVSEGYLLACFEEDVTEEVVTAIAKLGPQFAVFRDGSIASDSVLTNFEQIFATYSPQTVRKVI